jgi:hypothetical protein
LNRSVEIYAFLDIAANAPDANLPLKLDLRSELMRINRTHYGTDFAFQNDIRNTFIKLNDAHTLYYPPTCYNNLVAWQALAPIAYADANARSGFRIEVSPFFDDTLVQVCEMHTHTHTHTHTPHIGMAMSHEVCAYWSEQCIRCAYRQYLVNTINVDPRQFIGCTIEAVCTCDVCCNNGHLH